MTEPTIQPIGFHLRLSDDWRIAAVSANIGDYFGKPAAGLLGQPVAALLSDDEIHDIRNRMALLRSVDAIEHLHHFPLARADAAFDLAIFQSGSGFAIDAEPSDKHGFGDATGIVEGLLDRLDGARDVGTLCTGAARQLRALLGFDRILICGADGLLGQSTRSGIADVEPPAASGFSVDLALVDHGSMPVPILDEGPETPALRRSTLRSPTKVEASGLEAIGASAALVLPLGREGREWGHVGCYHATPRHVSAERRGVARLFARILSLKIEIAEGRRDS